MRQLEEENLRLKKLVADLNLDKAMLQDVLARKNCASARMGPGPAGTARGRSVLHYRSAAALSATVLWRQTTEHYAFVSGRSPQPGSTIIRIRSIFSCFSVIASARYSAGGTIEIKFQFKVKVPRTRSTAPLISLPIDLIHQ